MSRYSLSLFLAIVIPVSSLAQAPNGPAPLLHVRFATPTAMRVTVNQAGPAHTFEAPVALGLRPGYVYRVAISNLPGLSDVTLFPTFEVIGNLQLPPTVRAANYPVPISFTLEDLLHARAGSYVKKVIYLECPTSAAVRTTLEPVPETELRPGQDLLDEARSLGRPMIIVRLGGRSFTADEMAREAIDGTILLPGETTLKAPAVPPHIPWACWQVYDPKLGPKPAEEECLRDGGDHGTPAGFDREGHLRGVDPADTVAEYKDNHGGRHVAVSNPVCICVPRFAALRTTVIPAGYDVTIQPVRTQMAEREVVLKGRTPSVQTKATVALEVVRARERANEAESGIGTLNLTHVQGLTTVSGRMRERVVTGSLVEKCPAPERPLVLTKCADKQAAQIGEIVTFTLRYSNRGGQPINDVAVVDSLTGRLEYVAGSSQSDRAALFTMQDNEAGSTLLRWEIGTPLLPGQTGEIKFQARVR
jgi:uncharacterized repeat protein (TIGR01451 family)